MLEVEALFNTSDGKLKGAPRDPDLVLSLRCELVRVLDLTNDRFYGELGTTYDELVSLMPSRVILNFCGKILRRNRLQPAPSVDEVPR